MTGAAIALADAADDAEAEQFADAARAAGAPCNVIDKPQFCEFQFGSIVNRSPVVIGISTDGAAPILAQAIRRRIETLLPPALADWGRLAKAIRASVNDAIQSKSRRRAFWERFAECTFSIASPAEPTSILEAITAEIGDSGAHPQGRVTLVGAGPGDAEFLTLKAVRAMQAADVILYEDLVSDDARTRTA